MALAEDREILSALGGGTQFRNLHREDLELLLS